MTAIPAVELPQDRDAAGMGGPEAELHPRDPLPLARMGSHAVPDVVVIAFGKQVAIQFSHPLLAEGPGIVLFMFDAARSTRTR